MMVAQLGPSDDSGGGVATMDASPVLDRKACEYPEEPQSGAFGPSTSTEVHSVLDPTALMQSELPRNEVSALGTWVARNNHDWPRA